MSLETSAQFALLEGVARATHTTPDRYARHAAQTVNNPFDAVQEYRKVESREAYRQALLIACQMLQDNDITDVNDPDAEGLHRVLSDALLFDQKVSVDTSVIVGDNWKIRVKKEVIYGEKSDTI